MAKGIGRYPVAVLKLIRRVAVVLLVLYLALFGLTKAIRYPEPIAAIKLGLAPASKTPDLMPFHVINASPSQSNAWQIGEPEVITEVTWGGIKTTFDEFLSNTQTNAFLVIRGGKITYEKYFNGKNESTVFPSYSVAKTMTSLVIGQLIDEGKIKDLSSQLGLEAFGVVKGKGSSEVIDYFAKRLENALYGVNASNEPYKLKGQKMVDQKVFM